MAPGTSSNIWFLLEGSKVGRRAATALTARKVLTTTKVGYHADGMQPGLNLQVTPGQQGLSRSWVFRYTSPTTKKRREMGLGSVDARSLAEARELVTLPLFRVVLNPRLTRLFCAVPRASVARTALG